MQRSLKGHKLPPVNKLLPTPLGRNDTGPAGGRRLHQNNLLVAKVPCPNLLKVYEARAERRTQRSKAQNRS